MNFKPDLKKLLISFFGGIFLGVITSIVFTPKSRCYEVGDAIECVDTTLLPFLVLGSIISIILIYCLLSLKKD